MATPFVSTFADKYPRKLVMMGSDLYCAVLVVAAAICLYAGTPAFPIFALAALTSFGGSSFRAAQGAITPQLATTPDELTASNGTASTLESLAIFVGPAIGAGLLAVADVELVFLLNAASFLLSMLDGLGHPREAPCCQGRGSDALDSVHEAVAEAAEGAVHEAEGFFVETSAGFRTIARDKDLLSPSCWAAPRPWSPAPRRCSRW